MLSAYMQMNITKSYSKGRHVFKDMVGEIRVLSQHEQADHSHHRDVLMCA